MRNSSRWNQQTHACRGTTGDTDWMQAEIMRLIKGFLVSVVLHRVLVRPLSRACERFMGASFLAGLKGRSACGRKHQNGCKIRESPPVVTSN